jgi:uncharacterized protein (UPF0264 family)
VSRLLVSVRSGEEALAALEGGAALIDVKEPSRGPLGWARNREVMEVVRVVAGRCPVSAARGELFEGAPLPRCLSELAYLKWGLRGAGCSRRDWRAALGRRVQYLRARGACRVVAAAYADWRLALAPPPDEVLDFAIECGAGAFLIDTCKKGGATLLDWLDLTALARLRQRCRDAGMRIALAGSLGLEQIALLKPLAPDWFAVRGAACVEGDRKAGIDPARVRELAALVAG